MEIRQTFSISNEELADMAVEEYGKHILHDIKVGLKNFSHMMGKYMYCDYTINGHKERQEVKVCFIIFFDNTQEELKVSIDVIYLLYNKMLVHIEDVETRTGIADQIKNRIEQLLKEKQQ